MICQTFLRTPPGRHRHPGDPPPNERSLRAFRPNNVIVNNAGYGLLGATEALTNEQIRHQVDTDLIGSIEVVRAALPRLRAQGGDRFLQLSSTEGNRLCRACLFVTSRNGRWRISSNLQRSTLRRSASRRLLSSQAARGRSLCRPLRRSALPWASTEDPLASRRRCSVSTASSKGALAIAV